MQLVMRRPNLEHLPTPALPSGYTLRAATAEDAPMLAAILSSSFDEHWTSELAHQRFFDDPSVLRTFLVESQGQGAATASNQVLPDRFPGSGVIHWVGAAREHVGKGLGLVVCLAVLHDQRQRGCKDAILTTDDHRLAAIKTYLKLGFEPLISHSSHPQRWQAVLDALG